MARPERRVIPAPWVGALGLLLGCSGPAKPSVVIDHVTVVDVVTGASHQDQMVRSEGRWIQAITSSHEARAARGTTQVDGTGKYLIPGLWDMHVHLGGSEPWLGVLVAFGINSSISWVFPYAPTSWRSCFSHSRRPPLRHRPGDDSGAGPRRGRSEPLPRVASSNPPTASDCWPVPAACTPRQSAAGGG